MKNLLLLFLIHVLSTNFINATEQVSDNLYYNGEKLTIDIGWGHPSPLETYYQQNNLSYPFTMLSTANYRGHIATWKIENDNFYITEIAVRDSKHYPEVFNVKSQNDSLSSKGQIFADWFSGVLVSKKRDENNYWKIEYAVYIYVQNGVIQKSEKITQKDIEQIQNLTAKDTSDTSLMNKYSMVYLNQSYISYYFRLHDKEIVKIEDKTGFIKGKTGLSVILEKYNNSHLDWPYNWENFEQNGAPNATYEISEDTLFITEIHLNTGLSFDSPDRIPMKLSSVFPGQLENNKVIAHWTNGIYIITHGEEVADQLMPEMKTFKEKEYTLVRIKEGAILEKHTISSEFDFENIPVDTDEALKKIIQDLKKQRE